VTSVKPTESKRRELEPQLIERPRLLEMLDGSDARVIALIAPAGFGKTTLARQWASSRNAGGAWYSVGSEGFDVAAVAARIAAIVSTVVSGAGKRMLTRLSVSTDPEAEAVLLAELLSKEIAAWPGDARLVIDDYQALSVSRACERFIGTLVRESPLRLLITSRKRPSWAGSRLRLYGELFEITRIELEMTQSEAREVLAAVTGDERRTQLTKLCRGWPAVLGLAARLGNTSPPRDALLPGLYDYFAEELYQNAPADLQRFLCQTSAAPCLTRDLLERIGGTTALELAAAAEQSGFFYSTGIEGDPSLHPLLRDFLEHRLRRRRDRIALVDELVEALLASDRWDDVWRLIQECDRADLLPDLVERSLPTLLDGSRLPALVSWTEFGRSHKVVSPILDLAEAEMAFLAGEHGRAYALALQATHHFDESSPLRWRAHAIAARSAHFSDQLEAGITHAQKARALAPDNRAVQHCLWTEFLCAYELENEGDCSSILEELEESQSGHPDTTARVVQGRYLLSNMLGCEVTEDTLFERVRPLLDRVHPQIRASLLYAHCDHLANLASFSEAENGLIETRDLLEKYNLLLALAPVYCVCAISAIGLRRYRHADLLLDAASQATGSAHGSISTQIRIIREVASLLRGDRSVDLVATRIDENVSRCLRGLGYAVDALKWACRGDVDTALAYAACANKSTEFTDTIALTGFVSAIVACRSDSAEAESLFSSAVRFATERQRWNHFVWAYRAYPGLLDIAANEPKLALVIQPVLKSARDAPLAARHGIELKGLPEPQPASDERLTPREREVLRLAVEGLSNREIAGRLFISEVTVKVHLRHIYEKLGVRNRMEAALHAVYSE
jgi:ATP/maltotriose-dependent transcriptional regulator MalT